MPKKFSIVNKRAWLQAHDAGTTVVSIAGDDHCDIRTVKKGIEEARTERDASLARAELIKEALRNHNVSLLKTIRGILLALKVPSSGQAIPWKKEAAATQMGIEAGTVQYESWLQPKVISITLDVEDKPEWELLRQHLRGDRLWKLLDQWKKALSSYLEARMIMKRRLANLLKEKTGCQLVDKPIDGSFLYSHSVDILFQQAIQQLPRIVNIGDLTDSITVSTERGEVRYGGGTVLAHALGTERECKEHILSAVNELLVSSEASSLIDTYRAAEGSSDKVVRSVEEIDMLGLVPGQCRICRRLGI